MKRPSHPDFWLIAKALQDIDAAAEDGIGIERVVESTVDNESLMYTSEQRVLRTGSILPMNRAQQTVVQAVWMDAFLAGALYQKYKTARREAL